MKRITTLAACALAMAATNSTLRADNFGSGANTFTIDFVNIGNAGNADDTGDGGGSFSSPYGGVSYNYRMGVTEVSQDWITKATNLGVTNLGGGAWTDSQPAATMTWYQAAAFVNYLNTSTGHHAAYQIDAGVTALTPWSSAQAWQLDGENLYRHKDAYFFLPSEDEWYKAAFHKNDGVTANYWDYATGSNAIPDGLDFNGDTVFDAVFNQGFDQGAPNAVTNVGLPSAYGTLGQDGNVWDWVESAFDGVNDSSSETREIRGGTCDDTESRLRSSLRFSFLPQNANPTVGFRVASVPEPSCTILLSFGAAATFAIRRRTR